MANVAVFLDRDDTIIEDPGYISDPAQIKLLGGVVESLEEPLGAWAADAVVQGRRRVEQDERGAEDRSANDVPDISP